MLLHLEKAHTLPVKDLKFVRQPAPGSGLFEWTTVLQGISRLTLIELEIALLEPKSDQTAIPAPDTTAQRTVDPATNDTAGDAAQVASWTPSAMQQLYRERDLRMA